MSKTIFITKTDFERILNALQSPVLQQTVPTGVINALKAELGRAKKVTTKALLPHVVTMNSKVEIVDVLSTKTFEFTLVYPDQANLKEGKLSVLTPLGTALLGYSQGDEIEWDMPAGKRTYKIEKILYQPEASGDMTL